MSDQCRFCDGDIRGMRCIVCGARASIPMEERPAPKKRPPMPKMQPPQPQGPSLIKKTKNFAKSAARHISNGLPVVDNAEMEKRLKLCVSCDRYNSDNKTCSECGCYVDIKTKWALESCPLKKWDKMDGFGNGYLIEVNAGRNI